MTLEELKEEARKQGYNLIPIKKYVKLAPCTCGRKRIEEWYAVDIHMWQYKCPNCGLTGYPGVTHDKAKIGWNKKVEEKNE